jgi:hypothetical protein
LCWDDERVGIFLIWEFFRGKENAKLSQNLLRGDQYLVIKEGEVVEEVFRNGSELIGSVEDVRLMFAFEEADVGYVAEVAEKVVENL